MSEQEYLERLEDLADVYRGSLRSFFMPEEGGEELMSTVQRVLEDMGEDNEVGPGTLVVQNGCFGKKTNIKHRDFEGGIVYTAYFEEKGVSPPENGTSIGQILAGFDNFFDEKVTKVVENANGKGYSFETTSEDFELLEGAVREYI